MIPCRLGRTGVAVGTCGLVGTAVGGIFVGIFVGGIFVGGILVGGGEVGEITIIVGGFVTTGVGLPAIAVAVKAGFAGLQGSRSFPSIIPSLSESGVSRRGQVWFSWPSSSPSL